MDHQCTERETLTEIKVTLARMEEGNSGILKTFADHVTQGRAWRIAVIGIAAGLVLELIGFSYLFGMMNKTIEVNERIIQRILTKYEHLDMEK